MLFCIVKIFKILKVLIYLLATWTSPCKCISIFISVIYKADSGESNKFLGRQAVLLKILLRYCIVKEILISYCIVKNFKMPIPSKGWVA